MNVKLYTTVGCHLCEDALALLQQASQSGADLEISEIEISDEDELLDRSASAFRWLPGTTA